MCISGEEEDEDPIVEMPMLRITSVRQDDTEQDQFRMNYVDDMKEFQCFGVLLLRGREWVLFCEKGCA